MLLGRFVPRGYVSSLAAVASRIVMVSVGTLRPIVCIVVRAEIYALPVKSVREERVKCPAALDSVTALVSAETWIPIA